MKKQVIDSCYHACPFFGLDGGPGPVMYCQHPSFTDYEGFIINQSNCHGRVPDECPLRKEPAVIEAIEISLKG